MPIHAPRRKEASSDVTEKIQSSKVTIVLSLAIMTLIPSIPKGILDFMGTGCDLHCGPFWLALLDPGLSIIIQLASRAP
jgi:hypothetical protein